MSKTSKRKIEEFNKITNGFIIQKYKTLSNGTTICAGQEFIAGDVAYETLDGVGLYDGEIIGDGPLHDDIETFNTDKEVYCPFETVQPKEVIEDGNKEVTILHHTISYFLRETDLPITFIEEEHIEYMICQGFSEGDLYMTVSDSDCDEVFYGYWKIKK